MHRNDYMLDIQFGIACCFPTFKKNPAAIRGVQERPAAAGEPFYPKG